MRKLVLITLLLLTFSAPIHSQVFKDISVSYSFMRITEAHFDTVVLAPEFFRHNATASVGIGQGTIGMIYQHATKDELTPLGKIENGFMLTGGYDFILSESFRIETYGRVGVLSETDASHPLYATDTDLRLKLVVFDTDGVGWSGGSAFFPSAYIGGIVNRYGRLQGISGVGMWWKGINIYATGYMALNGVEDVNKPGADADYVFANLKNSGITTSISYQIKDLQLRFHNNFPINNAGNDMLFSLRYQFYFE